MSARLADHTTLRLGGPARDLEVVDRTDGIVERLRALDAAGTPVLLLGGGSNLVVADEGFAGAVLKIASSEVRVTDRGDDVVVTADAGTSWDALVARAADSRWSGIEALSGIPGSVGATPMQNVGAYGQEVSDVISRVRVYDRRAGVLTWIDAAACGFGYRSSDFRGRSDRVIVEVEMVMRKSDASAPIRYAELAKALGVGAGETAPLARVRETVIALRRAKGMVLDDADPESRSAGSFFTNPIVDQAIADRIDASSESKTPRFAAAELGKVKLAAGWLIERAGIVKGQRFGRVHVSKKHALALVTEEGATTRELLDAARAVQRAVRDRFGVTLEPEPIFVGCSL